MASSRRPLALVVEDDEDQRELLGVLFEESDMRVLQCESAEAAVPLLEQFGPQVSLLFTDIQLAGVMDGTELANFVRERYPDVMVIVTSGRERPDALLASTKFMPKPWLALDVLREAERSLR
jgi:CheY-like chemotaxis protein